MGPVTGERCAGGRDTKTARLARRQTRIVVMVFVIGLFCSERLHLLAQVNTEWMRKDAGLDGVHGGASVGAAVETGNSDLLDITLSGRVDGRADRLYAFVVGSLRRSLSGGTATRNNAFAHVRVAVALDSDRAVQVEMFVQKQFDDFLKLKDRMLGGGGIRLRALALSGDSVAFSAHIGIGAMFETELTEAPDQVRTDLVRSTNYLTVSARANPTLSLLATLYFQPALQRIHDYRMLVEGQLSVRLTRLLSLFVSANYRFDSEPLGDLKRYDLKLSNGLSVEF